MSWWRWDGPDLLLELRVTPRGGRDAVEGLNDGRLRLRLRAPPVDDRANEALTRLLAEAFGVGRAGVLIEHGGSARSKRVRIRAPRALPAWFTELGGGRA